MKLSANKIVNVLPNDTFVWCIDDKDIISKIKSNKPELNTKSTNYPSINSYNQRSKCCDTIFRLYNAIWHISIFKTRTENINTIDILGHCIDSHIEKGCRVFISLIETGCHKEIWGPHGRAGFVLLRESIDAIKKTNSDKLTVRFNVSKATNLGNQDIDINNLNNVNNLDANGKLIFQGKQTRQSSKGNVFNRGQNIDVALRLWPWLNDVVQLPQYFEEFLDHDLNDMEIVKLMKEKDLINIGVKKVGHRIRFLKHIADLSSN